VTGLILGALTGVALVAAGAYRPRRQTRNHTTTPGEPQ